MKQSHICGLSVSCGIVALMFGASAAWSQTADAPAAAAASDAAAAPAHHVEIGSVQEDIVVTARRREENVQRVPVAITAFSQATLERKSIASAFDLNKAVPGLNVSADSGSGTLPAFSIRGRGQFFGAAAGSVETYFADVPLSAPFEIPTLPPQFFDLQSVSVLKGPQGTLFGRNSTGGAVLFVPAAPTDEFGGYARLQGGTHDDVQFEAAVNLPISDKVMFRVAGYEWHRKGYTKVIRQPGVPAVYGAIPATQRYDNQDITEARATLLLKPTDNFTNSTIFTYHTDENRGAPQLRFRKNPLTNEPIYVTGPEASPRISYTDVDLRRPPSSTWAVINTTTYDLSDNVTLKNIFGHIHAVGWGDNPGDADGSADASVDLPRPLRYQKNFQTTDELQLQGSLLDDRLTYIAGGLIDLTRQPGKNSDINIATNSLSPSGTTYDEQFRQSHFTSYSAFGSLTYKLFDKLSVTGGVRHTWDNIGERNCEYAPAVSASDASACAATVGFVSGKEKFKGLSYNGSAEFRPTDATMLYGGYRHGYKRGGFNAKGDGLSLFGPEKVDDFYAGVKQDLGFLGIHGHLNMEGFYDTYHGAQRSYLAFDPDTSSLSTVVVNADKMTYRGFDTDFVADVTPWLEVSGNYTFVDAYYNKFADPGCPASTGGTVIGGTAYCFQLGAFATAPGAILFPGGGGAGYVPLAYVQSVNPGDMTANHPGLVSKHKFSLTARFHKDLGDGGEIAIAPTVSYQSRFYFNDQNIRQPNAEAALFGPLNPSKYGADYAAGYKQVDLRVEWNHAMGSKVDLAFNGNNLFNKTYITGSGGIYIFGYEEASYGPPRMLTVEAKVHF